MPHVCSRCQALWKRSLSPHRRLQPTQPEARMPGGLPRSAMVARQASAYHLASPRCSPACPASPLQRRESRPRATLQTCSPTGSALLLPPSSSPPSTWIHLQSRCVSMNAPRGSLQRPSRERGCDACMQPGAPEQGARAAARRPGAAAAPGAGSCLHYQPRFTLVHPMAALNVTSMRPRSPCIRPSCLHAFKHAGRASSKDAHAGLLMLWAGL